MRSRVTNFDFLELEDKKTSVAKYEEKVSALQGQVDDLQRKYQAASVGMSADEEGEKTLTNRLMGNTHGRYL